MEKDTESMRVARVRQLFGGRPSVEHTEKGILLFCAWLKQHYSHLLSPGPGDPCQRLKVDLAGLYQD